MAFPSLFRASSRPAGGRRAGLRGVVLVALAFGSGLLVSNNPFRPSSTNPDATARGYLRFKEVLSYVDRDYVDSVNTEGLADYATAQMLERLDPHSVYIPALEREQNDAFLQGDFDGVGLEFNLFRDTMTVVAPLGGGAAAQAGLLPGDQVLRVGGAAVSGAGLATARITQLLRGPRGSTVALEVRRPQPTKTFTLNLVRARVANSSIDAAYLIDEQTGYLKLSRFAANTADEFRAALADLRRQGMARLVLDLRGNPGGYLDRATRVADEFVAGSRKIVSVDGKGDTYDAQTYAKVPGEFEEGPLVVLIDEGSASAAEVVAGALQDHDRALLVGRRTFGKGLVQQPIALSDGGELRLTIARYYTPSGRSIQKPYGGSRAAYRRELSERAARGELASADSNHVAAGPCFRTDSGRPVYGGGGIMPDVFVARDTLACSAYFARLQAHHVPRALALAFYQAHKTELEGLRFAQFNATFRVSDAQLAALAAAAARDGVAPDAAALRRCAPLLRNQLKAYIAQSAYGTVPYYTVLREQDAELRQALRTFGDGSALLALAGSK